MSVATHFRSQWQSAPFEEWSYLQGLWRLLLLVFSGALSILPVFADSAMLPPPYSSWVGISVFVFAVTGYWIAGHYESLGSVLSVTGTWIGVLLIIQWSPLPGVSVLTLIPVLLATRFIGLKIGFLCVCLAGGLMLIPNNLLPSQVSAERTFVLLLLATFWSVEYVAQGWTKSLVGALYTDYRKAKAELEDVRGHRLSLSQVNQDLVDAYVQLRRLNNLLRASRIEAEMARRAKEEFVANVSHELRTPLNMIIGLSEMILSSPDSYAENLPPTLLSDMRVIHRNSQHLSQLINDVLDLSQAEAGRLQLHRDWVDPRLLVDESLEVIKPLFQAKGLYLRKEVPHDLPSIYCDRVRIRQVLLNLLSNAGRFTQKGGATLHIAATDNGPIFSVADTGPGIPEIERDSIFEPFHQVQESIGEVWSGSGLGLRICQQFVNLHDGKMWLESNTGTGTTFLFSLPWPAYAPPISGAARWVNHQASREAYQKQSTETLPVVKRRILLLDAEKILARQFQAYLHGAEVVNVQDLAQVKAELERFPPDLLFVNDIRVMEDKDFIHKAITLPQRMPVLSCYVPGREDAWSQLNVRDYLTKPMTRQALLATVIPLIEENATILVVEDDRDTARLTRRQLASAHRGYRILVAPDATTALAMLRKRKIDLVCLDINLPDLDGYEVLLQKNANAQIRHIPVVIISARDSAGDPVLAGRLRIELADNLSVRDIVRCVAATHWALATTHPASAPGLKEMFADSPAFE